MTSCHTIPTMKYVYSETINDVMTAKKSYRFYSGLTPKAWLADDNSYRRITKCDFDNDIVHTAFYYNTSLDRCDFYLTIKPNSSGKYFLFTIDGGEETVQNHRPLSECDYYMNDGSIIPYTISRDIPDEVKEDCLGVVIWVGENNGIHWTQSGTNKGDHLLMRDHPTCTHGIVVALHDASAGAEWATGSGANENLYDWTEDFQGFNEEEQADWLEIQKSSTDNHGYCTSHLVKLYGTHHTDATFPAYNAIGDYATLHPAPGSSSGWYFPSRSELTMMCYGMADNYNASSSKHRRGLLNSTIRSAGGVVLNGIYWSSAWDRSDYIWFFDFTDDADYGIKLKTETHKVRAVLAF